MSTSTDGLRSITLQQVLVKKWKKEIKKRPAAQRDSWLRTQEAFVALGVNRCRELLKRIADDRVGVAQLVPSGAWLDAWWAHNQKMPHLTVDPGRRYSVRTMLSRGMVRFGEEGIPHRRWTPPQAVDVEDVLDCMGNLQAEFYDYPSSPSAMAIHRICTYSKDGLRRLAAAGRW